MERVFELSIWKRFGLEPPQIFISQQGDMYRIFKLRGIEGDNVTYVSTGAAFSDAYNLSDMAA